MRAKRSWIRNHSRLWFLIQDLFLAAAEGTAGSKVAERASGLGQVVFGEGSGQAEPGEHAVVAETVDRSDAAAFEGQHDEPARVVDSGGRVPQVAAEGR